MYGFLLVLHLLICLSLVGVVLIQSGKGGGLAGGAFGGSAQTVFGGRGATDFFTKATMVLGAAFFVSSLVLALMTSGNPAARPSLLQTEAKRTTTSAPAQPGQAQPGGAQIPAAGAPAPGVPAPATSAPPTSGGVKTPPPPASGGGR